jgi:hypothetical protein
MKILLTPRSLIREHFRRLHVIEIKDFILFMNTQLTSRAT